jgi:integrase
MGGIFIPPRRLKDFVDFKLHNIDKTKDNYRYAAKLYFNSYKTAKTYGEQVIPIPLTLARILKRWEMINDKDYLFYDSKGNQLTNVKLNQRLNKIFGKKVSVNQLRHTYLTHKYGSLINEKHNLKEDFKMMGSSIAQELVYIKET